MSRLAYYSLRNIIGLVIRSFRCKDTETLFGNAPVLHFQTIERVARRKLRYLHNARRLDDLARHTGRRASPAFRLNPPCMALC